MFHSSQRKALMLLWFAFIISVSYFVQSKHNSIKTMLFKLPCYVKLIKLKKEKVGDSMAIKSKLVLARQWDCD